MRIIAIVTFWYALKIFFIQGMGGASQACVEGGNCSVPSNLILFMISPVFTYWIAGVILIIEQIFRKNTKAIDKAISNIFIIHIFSALPLMMIIGMRYYFAILYPIFLLIILIYIWLMNKKIGGN